MKLSVAFYLSVTILAISSCTPKNPNDGLNPLLKLSRNIISTRAQNTKQFVAVVKLKSPALLENVKKLNGKAVVDKELLAQINAEQDEAIKSLKQLSPDVQVIYRYRMVLNALAILAPIELQEKINGIGLVAYSEASGTFERPKTMELSNSVAHPRFAEHNSAKFIGATALNAGGITGKGVKVGVIDTGIDYTHSMLGGIGSADAYKAIDPSQLSPMFPNKKVVGGIDLVGTKYDAASPDFATRLPSPDMNPLDEAGHGTHVAGTVAGLGDGVNSYNGMAPDADLYAIKVFGAEGSTSDFVVIAALEYAADPNADGEAADSLDIVNLSLGSSYGNPHILYTEAIKNLVSGGTVTVASAGNSGHEDYIVGAPGTSDAALSVAASVDDSEHLWKFAASKLNLPTGPVLVEAIEAATTRKIADGPATSGKLVYVGLAAEDLDATTAAAVKGNVALIDRGQVNFNDKIRRAAEAGAIGVVVANNKDGAAFSMGTSDSFNIPAIMISLPDARKVKEAMKTADVSIDFKTEEKIEHPELIDTLTDFTSKGPRSIDGAIKPEIAAPGANIISAAMGHGSETVQMSGTSMAAPHMAGVMALLKQSQPQLNATELKALAMGGAKTIGEKGTRYSVSLQGAGRVQADVSARLKLISDISSISLGEMGIESKKTIRRLITLSNLTDSALSLTAVFDGSSFVTMPSQEVKVAAKSSQTIAVSLTLDATQMGDEKIREMDGWVLFKSGDSEVYRIPVLAVAHKLSAVKAGDLLVHGSALDAEGAAADVTVTNASANAGEFQVFNLVGLDERKPAGPSFMNADCDLQAVGYRIAAGEKSGESDRLQIGVKLFKPMTKWFSCDVSILIDSDGDGVVDQELLGSSLRSLPGQKGSDFATTLLDAKVARQLRKAYENKLEEAKGNPDKLAQLKGAENYNEAILDQGPMKVYNNSTVVVLEIPTENLAKNREGHLTFKVVVTNNEQSSIEFDDDFAVTAKQSLTVSLKREDQSFLDLPQAVPLSGGQSMQLGLTKGAGDGKLLLLMPFNRFSRSDIFSDLQMQILDPQFKGN